MSAPVGSRAMSPRCAPDPAGCVTMTGSMVATVTFRGQLQRAKGGGVPCSVLPSHSGCHTSSILFARTLDVSHTSGRCWGHGRAHEREVLRDAS